MPDDYSHNRPLKQKKEPDDDIAEVTNAEQTQEILDSYLTAVAPAKQMDIEPPKENEVGRTPIEITK